MGGSKTEGDSKVSDKPEESFPETTLKASIQIEVRKKISDITASILDDVFDCIYKKIQPESNLKFKVQQSI